jgi:nucleotide-binding universal stress UspA family protein
MPASKIDECAESGRADLVVLGTHGRGGFGRLLLGSVAERALRMAGRPTLIVRPHPPAIDAGAYPSAEPASGPQAPAITHILCPVNYSEVAQVAFEHACSVARTFGARLTVLFAVEQKHLTPEGLVRAEEELRFWLPEEPEVECQMQPVVRHGDAGEQVVTLAQEAGVDLVVIGAQHRRFVDTTVLGVTTVRVTRHAPCPVLVVPRSEVA